MDTMEVVDLNCSFRSYEKVKKVEEEEEFRRGTVRRIAIIVVSFVLLLGIVIVAGVMVALYHKGGGHHSSSGGTANGPDVLAMVCGMTSHPKLCYESLKTAMGGEKVVDPKELFQLSLGIAITELNKVSSLSEMLASGSNDTRVKRALQICSELIDNSIDHLKESSIMVTPGTGGRKMTESSINDITTWLSAAITGMETCVDGFDGTNSVFKTMIASKLDKAKEFISNSLAIAVNVIATLQELGVPLHRKLLMTVGTVEPGNMWVQPDPVQKRMLHEVSPWVADATVAKDKSGQFETISDAVAAAPPRSPKPFVIYIKGGRYAENVIVRKDKWNVIMIGDGADETIITGNRSFADGIPTFDTATFAVEGRGFMARDIGFENKAGPKNGPAVAVRSNSDRSIYFRCSFDGHENTLYALSLRQFYRGCNISGTVDFILGNAAVVFEDCTLGPKEPLLGQSNTILAQARSDRYQNTAASVLGCSISSRGNVTARTFLGRPLKPYATAVVMKSEIGPMVDPEGWGVGPGGGEPPPTVFFGEYENSGPGSSTKGRVKWHGYGPSLSDKEARKFLAGPLVEGNEWIPERGVAFSEGL